MTFEELRAEAKKQGYDLIANSVGVLIRKATAKDIFDLIDDYPTPTLVPGSDFDLGFNSALHAIKIAINNKYDLGEYEE